MTAHVLMGTECLACRKLLAARWRSSLRLTSSRSVHMACSIATHSRCPAGALLAMKPLMAFIHSQLSLTAQSVSLSLHCTDGMMSQPRISPLIPPANTVKLEGSSASSPMTVMRVGH